MWTSASGLLAWQQVGRSWLCRRIDVKNEMAAMKRLLIVLALDCFTYLCMYSVSVNLLFSILFFIFLHANNLTPLFLYSTEK